GVAFSRWTKGTRARATAGPDLGAPSAGCPRPLLSGIASVAEGVGDLVEDPRIVDRGRRGVRLAVGDLLHGAAQDLAGARLGQALHHERSLERGDRTDLLANALDQLLRQLGIALGDAGLGDHEAQGH